MQWLWDTKQSDRLRGATVIKGKPTLHVEALSPNTLIPLSKFAEVLNDFFDLEDEDLVEPKTPYVWWHRSQANTMAHPMPHPEPLPETVAAPSHWRLALVLHWFGSWRDLEIPFGVPAGDRVDGRGRVYLNPLREEGHNGTN